MVNFRFYGLFHGKKIKMIKNTLPLVKTQILVYNGGVFKNKIKIRNYLI